MSTPGMKLTCNFNINTREPPPPALRRGASRKGAVRMRRLVQWLGPRAAYLLGLELIAFAAVGCGDDDTTDPGSEEAGSGAKGGAGKSAAGSGGKSGGSAGKPATAGKGGEAGKSGEAGK